MKTGGRASGGSFNRGSNRSQRSRPSGSRKPPQTSGGGGSGTTGGRARGGSFNRPNRPKPGGGGRKLGEIIRNLPGAGLESHEGITNYLQPLGGGAVITPPGPIAPWDCEQWPESPNCGGGFDPRDIIPGISKITISISECEVLVTISWNFLGFAMPNYTIGYRLDTPECREEEPEPEPEPEPGEDPPIPKPIALKDLITEKGCIYCIVFYSSFPYNTEGSITYHYEGRLVYGEIFTKIRTFKNVSFDGFTWPSLTVELLEFGGFPLEYYGRDDFGEVSYINSRAHNNFLGTSPQECLGKAFYAVVSAQVNSRMGKPPWYSFEINSGKIYIQNPGQPEIVNPWGIEGYKSSEYYIYPHPFLQSEGLYKEYPCAIEGIETCKVSRKINRNWPLPMREDCCEKELNQIIARRLKRIETVLQPDKFHKFNDKGESTKVIGKAPNSMIFPKATGYYKIGGYDDLITFLIKYLDRNIGTMPISANIVDADPNTPGDQNAVLQFQSISEALGAIVEANGAEISLLYKLGNLIHANQKNLEILEKIAVSGLLETGICHQLAVVIQKNTESIQDYLDYKIRHEIVNVPFAFSPTIDPPVEGWTEKQYERWVQDFLKPSDVSVKVTELDYQANSKMLSDKLAEIAANAQAAAASSKRPVSSADDLKKLIEEEKTKLDIDAAYMVQLIRKAIGLPASIDLDGFGAGLAESFEDNANLDTGLIAEYPDKKHQIKRATKDGKKVN